MKTDGGPLVELALVVPIFMIMVVGMFSLGLMLNNYMVLTNVVGTSARNLALSRDITAASSDPCTYAITQAISNSPSLNLSAVTWTVTWTKFDSSGNALTPSTYTSSSAGSVPSCSSQAITQGDNVAVSAQYPVIFYQYGVKPVSTNLTARSAELMQ
ncbi:MAG: TadE/TadG family type IV pilus assembly protein [Terracidiphilus sp.]|nr:TadE/TadG family type IV pilus assembly protein [Terracidiphilus sp.]